MGKFTYRSGDASPENNQCLRIPSGALRCAVCAPGGLRRLVRVGPPCQAAPSRLRPRRAGARPRRFFCCRRCPEAVLLPPLPLLPTCFPHLPPLHRLSLEDPR